MKTVLDALNDGTSWLEKKNIENARKNMQLMLCKVLNFSSPMELYTEFDRPLDEEELVPLREMMKQRSQHIPLQHILGTIEFFKREFYADARALIPRPETEELVELILNESLNESPKILDIGTGSGVIGLTLALELTEKNANCTLVDLSDDALELAKKNAQHLGVENVTFKQSDLVQSIDSRFDLIVANLPYIPTSEKETLSKEVGYDPDLALFSGADGLDLIRELISVCKNYLNQNGLLAMEIGIDQSEEVENLLAEAGFSAIQTKSDLNKIARFPFARA